MGPPWRADRQGHGSTRSPGSWVHPAGWVTRDRQGHGSTRSPASWGHPEAAAGDLYVTTESQYTVPPTTKRVLVGRHHELSGVDDDRCQGVAPSVPGGAERASGGARRGGRPQDGG